MLPSVVPFAMDAPAPKNRTDWVCVAFVRGQCIFGNKCKYQHATGPVLDAYMAKVVSIPCRYGNSCMHVNCPYAHRPVNCHARIDNDKLETE